MINKIKKQSFSSFLRVSTISFLALFVLMSGCMYFSYQDLKENNAIVDDSIELILASDYMQKGSDRLTENTRFFVLTKDIKYVERYIQEAYATKTRDKGLEVLGSHYFQIDYSKLENAKAMSDRLLNKELWLMRLVCESENMEKIPYMLSSVELTDKEKAMTAEEKYDTAEEYLLFGEYNILKSNIDLLIDEVNEEFNEVAREKVAETNRTTYVFLICQSIIFALFVLWSVITLTILKNKIIVPISEYKKIYQKIDYTSKELSLVDPNGMEEVYQLGEVYNKVMSDLNEMKCEVEEKNNQLKIQKNLDPLTGVYNRGIFDSEEWQGIENSDYTVFCIDLNKFKYINDTYGHAIGDKVLIFISENLKNVVRESDLVVRTGGDEFVLIIKNVIDDHIIERVSNKLKALQGKLLCTENLEIPTYFGYGFAKHMKENSVFEEVLNLADERMYNDKHKKITEL